MYEEDKYSEFDRIVREKLSNAEEKVPISVWKGVSGRVTSHRRYAAGWSHSVIGMAAAAGLAICVVFAPGLVENITSHSNHQPLLSEVQPQVEVTTDFVEVTGLSSRRTATSALTAAPDSHETSAPFAQQAASVSRASSNASSAASEAVSSQGDAGTPSSKASAGSASTSSKGASSVRTTGPDPLDLLAYEESRSRASRVRADFYVSGIISTNDDITMGIKPGRMMSKSGSGNYSKGISQSSEDTFGIPVSFQLGARFFVNDWLGFGSGISYTLLTRTFTANYIEGGIIKKSGLDVLHTAQYVGIPVNAFFELINRDRTHIYTYAGVTGEKCISSRYDFRGSTDPEMLTEKVSGLQWSAGIGLGLQYDITRHVGIYADPSARYYFNCAQPRTARTAKPFMFDFAVGLRLNL